jgi:tRNA pseudouridine55 synthase
LNASNGVILIEKHKFVTSNEILSIFKRKTGNTKAGLMGILDPLATGILPVVFGEATKFIPYIENDKKKYEIKSKLGVFSECGDFESDPIEYENEKKIISKLNDEEIINTFKTFIGEYMQTPPMFSSTKHKGKPLYKYARKNINIERKAKKRIIYDLQLISLKDDILEMSVICSSGTYIRTLIQDISEKWQLHSCLYELHRSKVEPFDSFTTIPIGKIEADCYQEYVISIPTMLHKLQKKVCRAEEINKLYYGLPVKQYVPNPDQSLCLIMDTENICHGVGIYKNNYLYPKRLMKR